MEQARIGVPIDLQAEVLVPAPRRASIAEVRAWAKRKGLPVGERGHVPEEYIRRFNRTHKQKAQSCNPWRGK